jgi:localization factor PodJL
VQRKKPSLQAAAPVTPPPPPPFAMAHEELPFADGAEPLLLEPLPEEATPSLDMAHMADAPPFPSGSFEPPRPGESHSPMLAPEAADTLTPRLDATPAEAQDYLTQARRAAKAAAEEMSNRTPRTSMSGFPGIGSPDTVSRFKLPKFTRPVSTTAAVAAAVAGVVVLTGGVVLLRGLEGTNQQVTLPPNANVAFDNSHGAQSSVPSAPVSGADLGNAPLDSSNALPPAPGTSQAPASKSATATPLQGSKAVNPPGGGTAIERLTSKANAGDPKAALVLGLKYADGDGIPASDPEAVRWLEKAAQAGEAVAQYRLGTLYEKGRGVAVDPKQAASWYAQSAKLGNRKAMHNLAVAYADGAGIEKNFAEAARWFKSAAELGLTDSQFNLAVLYERGLGVPASLPEAYKWYSIAASGGDAESKMRVDVLATQLPIADKDAADKAVKLFKARNLTPASNDPPTLAQVIP